MIIKTLAVVGAGLVPWCCGPAVDVGRPDKVEPRAEVSLMCSGSGEAGAEANVYVHLDNSRSTSAIGYDVIIDETLVWSGSVPGRDTFDVNWHFSTEPQIDVLVNGADTVVLDQTLGNYCQG